MFFVRCLCLKFKMRLFFGGKHTQPVSHTIIKQKRDSKWGENESGHAILYSAIHLKHIRRIMTQKVSTLSHFFARMKNKIPLLFGIRWRFGSLSIARGIGLPQISNERSPSILSISVLHSTVVSPFTERRRRKKKKRQFPIHMGCLEEK